ncbi:hypothetical protein Bca4012_022342 [Brassica carinata]|uniref:Uncharacterized protein n=1 Tax=Brassica carinata TaxID=52824 RepID=A0A8X7TL17_BRACI|nr:hypothetical protein Bca52824_094180 [Brassica carinata]
MNQFKLNVFKCISKRLNGLRTAWSGMNGRKFGGNEVVAVFYPEDKFDQGEYGA